MSRQITLGITPDKVAAQIAPAKNLLHIILSFFIIIAIHQQHNHVNILPSLMTWTVGCERAPGGEWNRLQ